MKILLVSIAFPPKRDPESLQVARYCRYMVRLENIQLQVVTSKNPTLFMEVDETLTQYCDGSSIVKEVKIYENKYANYLIRRLYPDFLKRPDSKFSFWWQHGSVSKSLTKPDVLYSRSYPVSSTLLALELKKRWDIPWILHLSDPWAIGSEDSLSPATLLKGLTRRWNRRKEKECLQLADLVCLTSKKTIELYTQEYPEYKDKFILMPNVYDDELFVMNPFKAGSKLKFVYTGGFGEARSPYTLLEAIRLFWINNTAKIDGRVEFVFTGEMTRVNQELFAQYKFVPIIQHLGVIPYSKVIALQRSADILINVDSNIKDPRQSVFFPSKLLDYILSQRRILAITNRHSTTHYEVQDKLGECFEFDEINKIADYFLMVFRKFQNREEDFFYKPLMNSAFSAKENAIRLVKLFKELR